MKAIFFPLFAAATLFTMWQCQAPEETITSGAVLETQLTAHQWTAHSYIINGTHYPSIEVFHDQLRYPGEDLREIYRHSFQFSPSGTVEVLENRETHTRYFTSGSDSDWALDQDRCACTAAEEEWYLEKDRLFIRDGSVDLPHFLAPPYTVQQIAGNKLLLRGALRLAGYSEDLRRSIVKLNGMVTTGDGLKIDIVLVPGDEQQ